MAEPSLIFQPIVAAVAAGRYNVSRHAAEESMPAHRLAVTDVECAILHGEIIEDYRTDFPFPSCLIYGPDPAGRPVHAVVAYHAVSSYAVLVTAYRPDPDRWIDSRRRVLRK